MRTPGGWLAGVALSLLLPASIARATAPIVSPEAPRRVIADPDSAVGHIAQTAEAAGFSILNTGVLVGAGVMLAAIPAQSSGVLLAGYGTWAVSAVAGPAAGWTRAGYPGRGAGGVLVRAGLIAGCIAIPLSSADTRQDEFGGLLIASAALTGVVLATFQAYIECDGIGPYVRRHGPGQRPVALVPISSRSAGPGLALVATFP